MEIEHIGNILRFADLLYLLVITNFDGVHFFWRCPMLSTSQRRSELSAMAPDQSTCSLSRSQSTSMAFNSSSDTQFIRCLDGDPAYDQHLASSRRARSLLDERLLWRLFLLMITHSVYGRASSRQDLATSGLIRSLLARRLRWRLFRPAIPISCCSFSGDRADGHYLATC